jgi:hypothetical protein
MNIPAAVLNPFMASSRHPSDPARSNHNQSARRRIGSCNGAHHWPEVIKQNNKMTHFHSSPQHTVSDPFGIRLFTFLASLFFACFLSTGRTMAADAKPEADATPAASAKPAVGIPGGFGDVKRGFMIEWVSSGETSKKIEDAANIWHANIFRLMLMNDLRCHRENISLEEGFSRYRAELPSVLDTAKRLGVTLVINLPGDVLHGTEPTRNPKNMWDNEGDLAALIHGWHQIVKICAGRDQEIWYDLMNEPLDRAVLPSFPKQWPEWAQKMVDAIRLLDPVHPIVIEPGPGSLPWGFGKFPRLKGEHLIYSLHSYQPQSYTHQGIANIANTDLSQAYLRTQREWPGQFGDSGGGYWDKNRLKQELQPVFDFQKQNPDIRIFVGEFSVARWAPKAPQYLRDSIEIFEEHGWDWTYHAFRGSPVWGLDYTDDFGDTAKPAKGVTDRGAVILEYLQKNKPQKNE